MMNWEFGFVCFFYAKIKWKGRQDPKSGVRRIIHYEMLDYKINWKLENWEISLKNKYLFE